MDSKHRPRICANVMVPALNSWNASIIPMLTPRRSMAAWTAAESPVLRRAAKASKCSSPDSMTASSSSRLRWSDWWLIGLRGFSISVVRARCRRLLRSSRQDARIRGTLPKILSDFGLVATLSDHELLREYTEDRIEAAVGASTGLFREPLDHPNERLPTDICLTPEHGVLPS